MVNSIIVWLMSMCGELYIVWLMSMCGEQYYSVANERVW